MQHDCKDEDWRIEAHEATQTVRHGAVDLKARFVEHERLRSRRRILVVLDADCSILVGGLLDRDDSSRKKPIACVGRPGALMSRLDVC